MRKIEGSKHMIGLDLDEKEVEKYKETNCIEYPLYIENREQIRELDLEEVKDSIYCMGADDTGNTMINIPEGEIETITMSATCEDIVDFSPEEKK